MVVFCIKCWVCVFVLIVCIFVIYIYIYIYICVCVWVCVCESYPFLFVISIVCVFTNACVRCCIQMFISYPTFMYCIDYIVFNVIYCIIFIHQMIQLFFLFQRCLFSSHSIVECCIYVCFIYVCSMYVCFLSSPLQPWKMDRMKS